MRFQKTLSSLLVIGQPYRTWQASNAAENGQRKLMILASNHSATAQVLISPRAPERSMESCSHRGCGSKKKLWLKHVRLLRICLSLSQFEESIIYSTPSMALRFRRFLSRSRPFVRMKGRRSRALAVRRQISQFHGKSSAASQTKAPAPECLQSDLGSFATFGRRIMARFSGLLGLMKYSNAVRPLSAAEILHKIMNATKPREL